MPSLSRVLQIIRNVVLILAAFVAIFFLVVVPWFFSSIVTRRQFHYLDPNDGKTPISYHLNFSWIEFTSRDGIPLAPRPTGPAPVRPGPSDRARRA